MSPSTKSPRLGSCSKGLPAVCLLTVFILLAVFRGASATTYTVCDSSICDHRTIHDAVNARLCSTCPDGVTIQVLPGTYREKVSIHHGGSSSSPDLIQAQTPGTVKIDGAVPFNAHWTQCTSYAYYADSLILNLAKTPLAELPLFIDDVQYTYCPDCWKDCILLPGQFSYDADSSRIYVRTIGSDSPQSHTVLVRDSSAFYGISISGCSYLTLDGLQIVRTNGRGIEVDSSAVRCESITVTNCTSAYNARHGISLWYTRNCSIINDSTYSNGRHGIYLLHTDNATVANNVSYLNRNPAVIGIAGSQTGIKVGERHDSTDVNVVTVQNNIVHDNQDTGIDLFGCSQVTVRNNVSYRNGDHGYDNNWSARPAFINDVAARNDHDGLSVENTASNVAVSNCVFANNGVNPTTLNSPGYVAELQAYIATLKSDYNVMVGLPPRDTVVSSDESHYSRRLVEFPSSKRWTTFSGYVDSARVDSAGMNIGHVDLHSHGSGAAFVDSTAGLFRPRFASSVIDAADTTVGGWATTDVAAVGRHDCSGIANTGKPAGAYGDIGAYEYDDGMGAISVSFNQTTLSVTWAAHGRYGNASWKPSWYEVLVDGVEKVHRDNPSGWPGTIHEYNINMTYCEAHAVQVMTKDEYADSATSNLVWGSTPGCSDRPSENRGRVAGEEVVDVPLALQWPESNPSRGEGVVSWSIPQANEGATFELAIFDIAGRRVETIAAGKARAGKFAQKTVLGEEQVGVYFLQLRVGREVLSKRIVVVR